VPPFCAAQQVWNLWKLLGWEDEPGWCWCGGGESGDSWRENLNLSTLSYLPELGFQIGGFVSPTVKRKPPGTKTCKMKLKTSFMGSENDGNLVLRMSVYREINRVEE